MKKITGKIIILALAIVGGVFFANTEISAQGTSPFQTCLSNTTRSTPVGTLPNYSSCQSLAATPQEVCLAAAYVLPAGTPALNSAQATAIANCGPVANTGGNNNTGGNAPVQPTPGNEPTEFEKAMSIRNCEIFSTNFMQGCLRAFAYWIFFSIPAGILTVTAKLFNSLLALSIGTQLYEGGFIENSWAVVRDLSNIFFIFILLYIAIKMILGLGGHDSNKMIVWVIIMAMLINFSMFFTKVVIDASNIMALTIYNKIAISSQVAYSASLSPSFTGVAEKDIAGQLVGAFNITRMMDEGLLDKRVTVFGALSEPLRESTSLMIMIAIIAGAIMLFAAYAFFISGLSFLGRLVELWILIIFSPFAFMSYPVPKLSGVEGIGWSNWSTRLLSSAFMAPVFMFFLYLIAVMSKHPLTPKPTDTMEFMQVLILILIPSLIFIILLIKATDYAKKGSGQLGQIAVSVGKAAVVGGAMIATGGAAALGRGTVGATANYVKNDNARAKAMDLSNNLKNIKPTGWSQVNPLAWAGAGVKVVGVVKNVGAAKVAQNISGSAFGQKVRAADDSLAHKKHADHVIEEKVKTMYHDGRKFKELDEPEQMEVRKALDKDLIAKQVYKAKTFDSFDRIKDAAIIDSINTNLDKIYKDYATAPRGNKAQIDAAEAALKTSIVELDPEYQLDPTKGRIKKTASDEVTHANQTDADIELGRFSEALRKGTYDLRNLADLKIDTKGPVANMARISSFGASIIRQQLSMATGVKDVGTPQKDILKDLKHTLEESLKNIKVDIGSITVGGGGGGHGGSAKKGDDGHGGGGHGGGGHH